MTGKGPGDPSGDHCKGLPPHFGLANQPPAVSSMPKPRGRDWQLDQGVICLSPDSSWDKVQLVLYATQSRQEIQANCHDDVSLQCSAVSSDDMDFLSLAWYKVNLTKKDGIIRKSKGDKTAQRYLFNRSSEFGERHSLRLPNVMPPDSGTYECIINANVGGRNGKGKVKLKVHECLTQTETITSTWSTTPSNLLTVKDLPVVWTSAGYVVLAMAKIILSLIVIWVVHIVLKTTEEEVV